MKRACGGVVLLLSLAAVGVAAGCESSGGPTSRPVSFRERQDQALKDPMNYKPDFSSDRVSSGGISDFDKEGLKKDLRSVFDP